MTRPFAIGDDELRALGEQDVARGVARGFDDRFGIGVTEQAATESNQCAEAFLRTADDRHGRRRDRTGKCVLLRAASAASTVVRTVLRSKGLASVLCTPSERAISRTSRS